MYIKPSEDKDSENETKSMKLSRLLLVTIFSTLLLSCSSGVKRPAAVKVADNAEKVIQQEFETTDYYLQQAQRAYSRSNDISLRNQWLLRAAEALEQQQQCPQSIKFIQVIFSELQDNMQQTQAKIILAECYLALPEPAFQVAEQLIPQMARQVGFDSRISAIQAQLFNYNKRYIEASHAWLKSNLSTEQQTTRIWQNIQNLTLQELEQARLREPELQPWIQLSLIVRRYGLQPDMLEMSVQEWQIRFSSHPLAQALPDEVSRAINITPIKANNVAILLPLSGRLASQGQALKEGILAAYFASRLQNHSFSEGQLAQIQFFDSALKTGEELNAMVADYDVIIGPLLKEQIASLITQLPPEKALLALNQIDTETASSDILPTPESFFFALAPENEAEQLATHIKSRGFINPIVVASESEATRRMSDAFIRQWKKLSAVQNYESPALATFNDTKSIGTSVASILDVAQSKDRIRQINNLTIGTLHDVPRNRRDVDAIVVFANPEQTELLNPIIEASLSPFAETVPVFASSRSYSLELSKNSLRDLRNLSFTDMPWMLPDHPWSTLAEQTGLLWPQRRDNLLRLFAMGYDAYNLVPKLRHLQVFPHNTVSGLTGTLSISEQGLVQRQLMWGQVNDDKVRLIAMD